MTDASMAAGEIAARIDRLPLTWVQWRLALITQLAWGVIIALDGMPATIYPYVWGPEHAFGPAQFSLLLSFQFGIGILAGEYVMGYLGDRLGRRTAMILSAVAVSLLIWPTALTDNFTLLLLFFALGSLGMGGVLASNVVYMTEIAPPHIRGRLNQGAQTLAVLAAVVLRNVPAIFLLPQDYRIYIYLEAAFPLVVLLPFLIWGLPESPRWLEARGRRAEAERIMDRLERQVARYAGELPPPDLSRHRVEAVEHVPVREIFSGIYLRRTIVLMIAWILGYAGIVYGQGGFAPLFLAAHHFSAGMTFSTLLWTGIVGGVGALFVGSLTGERFERRGLILMGGVLGLLTAIVFYVWTSPAGLIVGALLGNAGLNFWLFNMYSYTAAAYPTRLRSVGTGWTDGLGHVGSVFGPIVAGSLFAATASAGFVGWLAWFSIPGGIIPGLLVYWLGFNQKKAVLEQISA